MQKIVPHLWFDKEAKEAAEFYVSVFENSKIDSVTTLHDTPSGDCNTVAFTLAGQSFMSISAGPYFTYNPSISFMVACETTEEVEKLWKKLSDGGTALMELGEYPFSKKYGWTIDKYGVSWQIILSEEPIKQKITPALLFVTDTCDVAETATDFYLSVFKNAKRGSLERYPAGMEPNKAGSIMFTDFWLEGQRFIAMDGSSAMHSFAFNEAVSLIVKCETQEEIDYYWDKLSAVPEAEQCGWLKDKYGVSWQIVPTAMDDMMNNKDEAKMARVTQAFLKMKKFDLAELERAAEDK